MTEEELTEEQRDFLRGYRERSKRSECLTATLIELEPRLMWVATLTQGCFAVIAWPMTGLRDWRFNGTLSANYAESLVHCQQFVATVYDRYVGAMMYQQKRTLAWRSRRWSVRDKLLRELTWSIWEPNN